MKKMLFLMALMAITLSAASQLRVIENGQVQIGDWDANSNSSISTSSTMTVLGNSEYFSEGSITFGGRGDVKIAESRVSSLSTKPIINNRTYGSLLLTGRGGITYQSNYGVIFSYSEANPLMVSSNLTPVMTYYIDVKAPQFLTSSDARLKQNIEAIENGGKGLESLSPVSYNLINNCVNENGETLKVSAQSEPQSTHRQYGFLAQEVREVFPDLVYEDEEGMLSIDYNGFCSFAKPPQSFPHSY